MKYLSMFVLMLASYCTTAQIYVKGQELDQIYEGNYLKVCEWPRPLERQMMAYVDYGELPDLLDRTYRITNLDGGAKYFKSQIDLINFITDNGWQLLQIAPQGEDGCLFYERKKKSE
jgi:hypothetical protein